MDQVDKLKSLGTARKLGNWIRNFLKGRTEGMKITEAKSILLDVLSCVPQGIVLGPILFLILLININGNISNNVSSFADDTRISRGITLEDVAQLQPDLQIVYA